MARHSTIVGLSRGKSIITYLKAFFGCGRKDLMEVDDQAVIKGVSCVLLAAGSYYAGMACSDWLASTRQPVLF